MDKFIVRGGNRLCGEVEISGAKNAAVAILPATLLCDDGICRIENIPAISDITAIIKILHDLGANVKPINKTTIEIDTRNVQSFILPSSMTTVPFSITRPLSIVNIFAFFIIIFFLRKNIAGTHIPAILFC